MAIKTVYYCLYAEVKYSVNLYSTYQKISNALSPSRQCSPNVRIQLMPKHVETQCWVGKTVRQRIPGRRVQQPKLLRDLFVAVYGCDRASSVLSVGEFSSQDPGAVGDGLERSAWEVWCSAGQLHPWRLHWTVVWHQRHNCQVPHDHGSRQYSVYVSQLNVLFSSAFVTFVTCFIDVHFSAWQHICRARYMLSPVCPSVHHTGGSVKNG